MSCNLRAGTPKHPFFVLALLSMVLLIGACQTDQVDVPDLTGPSGHRLFITMSADPDHLVIRAPSKPRSSSRITAQLKDQLGNGVPGEAIKFRIANKEGSEINIGTLDQSTGTTDSGGFVRATYKAPNTAEQPVPTRIYIFAIMINPAFTFEVTGQHALDLESAFLPPSDCVFGSPGAPVPAFTVNPAAPIIHEQACFDATATTDDGLIVSASWSFGDGGSATGLTPCHTFDSEGIFVVTLRVQDEDRNCADIIQTITVGTGEPGACTILVSPNNPSLGTTVNLVAEVTDDSSIDSFRWNFGDGISTSTSSNTTSHLYTSEGDFSVILTLTDDQGNVSTCTTTVTIGSEAPTCEFTFSPAAPEPNDLVNFNASTSTDPDGTIESFEWDFGDDADGTDATGQVVSHTFTSAGDFTVTLTLTDDQGNVTVCSQLVTVGTGQLPTCSFTATPTTLVAPFNVDFNSSGSFDADGTITSFTWNFGDGTAEFTPTPATDPTVSHSYTTAGAFTVTLSVTDNDGNVTKCQKVVTVGTPPTCNITSDNNPACVGENVGFDSNASDPDSGFLTFSWKFGDGTTSTEEDPAHVYLAGGTKIVELTVTDAQGLTCTDTLAQVVNAPPTITNFSPLAGPVGATVIITGTGFVDAVDGGTVTFFNGISATFDATSSTSITTTVPVGATDGPITVANGCAPAAVSAQNFDVCGALSITAPAATLEGDGGGSTPFTFTVSTTNSCSLAQSATFVTTNAGTCGDATENDDFDTGSPPSGTVTIPAASTNTPLTIQIDADDVDNTTECFTVTISAPVNATLGAPASAEATILNDD